MAARAISMVSRARHSGLATKSKVSASGNFSRDDLAVALGLARGPWRSAARPLALKAALDVPVGLAVAQEDDAWERRASAMNHADRRAVVRPW